MVRNDTRETGDRLTLKPERQERNEHVPPGVLKTGTPNSVMRSTGMLLTPAPARAMARHVLGTSVSCILCERNKTACAYGASSPSRRTSYLASSKRANPLALILLKHLIWYMPNLLLKEDGSPM